MLNRIRYSFELTTAFGARFSLNIEDYLGLYSGCQVLGFPLNMARPGQRLGVYLMDEWQGICGHIGSDVANGPFLTHLFSKKGSRLTD